MYDYNLVLFNCNVPIVFKKHSIYTYNDDYGNVIVSNVGTTLKVFRFGITIIEIRDLWHLYCYF